MSNWRIKYSEAHKRWQELNYPSSCRDFGHLSTVYPTVTKSNGLTRAIQNYLTWSGHYANRINVMGRIGKGSERQESGNILTVRKFIPSSTKRGTADLHCIVAGKHVSIEIKIGTDHLSDNQVKEQQRIIAAGGFYIVIKTVEQFFEWYDKFVSS